jgi:hypothetical protein
MAARRPSISESNLARRGRKTKWSGIAERQRERINLTVRQAAANIMNDLAERGPAYSGEFRDSWRALPLGGASTSASPGQYPYSTRNVPKIGTNVKDMERVAVFEIINIAPYALYAMDIIPGVWRRPDGAEPIGGVEFGIQYGDREFGETFRYEVSGEGENVSTAEANWYDNYVKGGGMSKAVARSIKLSASKGSAGVSFR